MTYQAPRWLVAGGVTALAALTFLIVGVHPQTAPQPSHSLAPGEATTVESMQREQASLAFEPNQGQTASHVKFISRGQGYGLFLTPTEAVFSLSQGGAPSSMDEGGKPRTGRQAPAVLRMSVVGGNPTPTVSGEGLLPGKSHYITGKDPAKWHSDVPQYGKVRYQQVYPGVDLVYYGSGGKLEYDFIVAPGKDPGQIALDFKGVEGIKLDDSGNLLLKTTHGELMQHKPVVYQEVGGVRRMIEGAYALLGGNGIGFKLGKYDLSLPLVIDPVLAYSTYLGGDGAEQTTAGGVDAAGNVYIAGWTNSIVFPWDLGNDSEFSGVYDAYVCRFTAAGGQPYCAYIGGTGDDAAWALAIGPNGNAYVAGYTDSFDFPVLNAHQPNRAAGEYGDTFLLKINSAGTDLEYSTYFGGNDAETTRGIVVDNTGAAYITGNTWSWLDFPATAGVLQTVNPAGVDAYVAKFNNAGALVLSTFLGGSTIDHGRGIALDNAGNIYVSGHTDSVDFPVQNPRQPSHAGAGDAFLAKLNPTASSLIFSTYHGGTGPEWGYDVKLDRMGNVYLAGFTQSTNFPTTPGAVQVAHGGGQDGFLSKFNAAGSGLHFSTYFGGTDLDDLRHLELDPAGNAYWAGYSSSPNFMLKNSLQPMRGEDGVLVKLDPTGKQLLQSIAIGGASDDLLSGLDRSLDGTIHLHGWTTSLDLPVAAPFQATHANPAGTGGGTDLADIFFTRIADATLGSWRGDFDGNGTDDLLWRNNATGAGSIWPSGNGALARSLTRVSDLNWQIVAVADFSGDGKSDILWRHAVSGANIMWRSGDYAQQQAVTGVTNTNWKVVGAGDFNGDLKADLLWRDTVTGTNAIWLGANNATQRTVTGVTNLGWEVIGVEDFDGDFRADILWRNTSNAQSAIWKGGVNATQTAVTGISGTDWRIVGLADYTGDGKADIFWRNARTGNNTIWISGSSATQQAVAPIPNHDWHPVGMGDYNNDGKADIVWRHRINGNNTMWRSGNSTTVQAVVPAGLDWNVKS